MAYKGRNELETLLASDQVEDWMVGIGFELRPG